MLGKRAVPFRVTTPTDSSPEASKRAVRRGFVPKHERSPRVGRRFACKTLEQLHLDRVCLRVLQAVPDRYRQSSARSQHSGHLSQGLGAVAEEHQAELAANGIERPVRERKRLGDSLFPQDVRRQLLGDGEHSPPRVDPCDEFPASDPNGRLPREDAGAACDIEDPISDAHAGSRKNAPAPLPEQGRHMQVLVGPRSGNLIFETWIQHGCPVEVYTSGLMIPAVGPDSIFCVIGFELPESASKSNGSGTPRTRVPERVLERKRA